MQATYIEGLSPLGIDAFTRTARQRLSLLVATQDHDLRRIIGHALLLDILVMEGEKTQGVTKEVVGPAWVSTSRQSNHDGFSSKTAISDVAETNKKDVPRSCDFQTVNNFYPASKLVLSRESSIGVTLERCKDISNETQRLLRVYRYFAQVSPGEYKDDVDSDSSSESDSLGSDEEDWD